jgi:hypothetical protein
MTTAQEYRRKKEREETERLLDELVANPPNWMPGLKRVVNPFEGALSGKQTPRGLFEFDDYGNAVLGSKTGAGSDDKNYGANAFRQQEKFDNAEWLFKNLGGAFFTMSPKKIAEVSGQYLFDKNGKPAPVGERTIKRYRAYGREKGWHFS